MLQHTPLKKKIKVEDKKAMETPRLKKELVEEKERKKEKIMITKEITYYIYYIV